MDKHGFSQILRGVSFPTESKIILSEYKGKPRRHRGDSTGSGRTRKRGNRGTEIAACLLDSTPPLSPCLWGYISMDSLKSVTPIVKHADFIIAIHAHL